MTREMHDADPESYWAMLWHSQSVQHIYCEHGWAVASEYHQRVMKAWMEGFLEASSFVETEDLVRRRRGRAAPPHSGHRSQHCKKSTIELGQLHSGAGRVVRFLQEDQAHFVGAQDFDLPQEEGCGQEEGSGQGEGQGRTWWALGSSAGSHGRRACESASFDGAGLTLAPTTAAGDTAAGGSITHAPLQRCRFVRRTVAPTHRNAT